MKYLAIDFGLRHLGLAVNFGLLVEPLGQIDYLELEKVLIKIKKICEEHKIEKIVIGVSEGKMAKETRRFGQKLKKQINLPIIFQDETLTSQEAKQRLIESKVKKKKRATADHQVAAALILQAFLDNQ